MSEHHELLGLPLETALFRLREMGIEPQITVTSAPKRRESEAGGLRVVRISQDGTKLTAAWFLNPLEDGQQENNR